MGNDIKYLVGNEIENFSPLVPYSDLVCTFLSDFSEEIFKDNRCKNFPDIISVAFFARKGNIQRLKKTFLDDKFRLGKGLAFHITPSNIPVQFIFSYFFGLLAGNANIVRVPSKDFPQIDLLCDTLNKVLSKPDFHKLKNMTAFVQYDKSSDWTKIFSSCCQIRLIWGGDSTIENVRKFSIPPRATELVFADRYSLAIFDEESVENLNETELERLAGNFYNDTYLADQNACSSPQLILWRKSATSEGREIFWQVVENMAMKRYDLPAIKATSKYKDFCQNAINFPQAGRLKQNSNFLYRAKVNELFEGIDNLRGKFGLFYEYDINSLDDIKNCVNEKYQTLTYFGFSPRELAEIVLNNNWLGIDRIVPVGKALDIGVIWDGYDLIGQMSRIVYFE